VAGGASGGVPSAPGAAGLGRKIEGPCRKIASPKNGLPGGNMGTSELDGASADLVGQLTDKVEGLEEALLSRDVIGQAKGILMERLHLTSEQAFEELRAASQKHNRKVRDIAAELAETGAWPYVNVNVDVNVNLDGDGQRPGA